MRVCVDIPELLPELVEFLSSRGYEVVQDEEGEMTVVPLQGPRDFQGAMTLLADLDVWRAKHPWATTRLDPELTTP